MNKQKKHDDCKEATFADQLFNALLPDTKLAHSAFYSTRLIYSRVCITTTNHVVLIRYGISYCIIASNRSTYTHSMHILTSINIQQYRDMCIL